MIGDNTKTTKKAVIQRKYKKCSIFVKNVDAEKILHFLYFPCITLFFAVFSGAKYFLSDFSKLLKVLSICAKFQVSGILIHVIIHTMYVIRVYHIIYMIRITLIFLNILEYCTYLSGFYPLQSCIQNSFKHLMGTFRKNS